MRQVRIFFFLILLPYVLVAEVEPLNEKWLEQDKLNMINLMEVLKSKSLDVNFYKKGIQNLSIRSENDLGFGLKRLHAYQYGGYILSEISFYAYHEKIFYSRIRIIGEDLEEIEILKERNPNISKFVSQKWIRDDYQPYPSLVPTVVKRIKYELLDEKNYAEFKKSMVNVFGSLLAIPIDSSLNSAYQILISPFEKYDFGTHCGYSGTRPQGRQAIEIIKKFNPELLKNIIRGYSVEGRVYGVEALLELARKKEIILNKHDINIIKKVLNLSIPINQCGGCSSRQLVAKEIFKNSEYKEFLIQNNINLLD